MKDEPDYTFCYPLDEGRRQKVRDPLEEMIRTQLESLLKLLTLYREGEEVRVDGFRLMNEREAVHKIFGPAGGQEGLAPSSPADSGRAEINDQSASNAELYEPRIPHIRRVLESILSVVVLESDGKPVTIDGFRLKDLEDWLATSAGDPAEIFDHLATQCDCHCSFCYIRGNPPSLALRQPSRKSAEEWEEAKTRLKYFSPPARRALFPALGSPHEFLSHPRALDLLRELRSKSDRPFRLSTNGNQLTRESIEELSSLKPVYLYLSLNTASRARRKEIMGGSNSHRGIEALPLLQEKKIPYAAVIVPWPVPSVDEMTADLRETIFYADRFDAHLVEVSLPGYTRFFSPSPSFDLDEVWTSIISTIRDLREKVHTPLVVKPSLYEEIKHRDKLNQAWISGVVKNSPAALSGLRGGDRITSIAGLKIASLPQARDLLRLKALENPCGILISLERRGQAVDLVLSPSTFGYPYLPDTDHHLGVIFPGAGFRPSLLEELKTLISSRGAKQVLLFSSRLVQPVFQQLLQESNLFGKATIHVEVPENRYFGGNIFMGDLLVVQDFIEAGRNFMKTSPPPDLIVIPSSPFALGQWKRDLEGRVYTEIERDLGVPVALLECETIYD